MKHTTKKTKEFLKYQFTHEEIHEKGIELARLSSERNAIESERKAIASEFKAKLDTLAAQMDNIGGHINNGYDHRYIDCIVFMNDPNTGMKTTYRADNNEQVRREAMTAEEMQIKLELNP